MMDFSNRVLQTKHKLSKLRKEFPRSFHQNFLANYSLDQIHQQTTAPDKNLPKQENNFLDYHLFQNNAIRSKTSLSCPKEHSGDIKNCFKSLMTKDRKFPEEDFKANGRKKARNCKTQKILKEDKNPVKYDKIQFKSYKGEIKSNKKEKPQKLLAIKNLQFSIPLQFQIQRANQFKVRRSVFTLPARKSERPVSSVKRQTPVQQKRPKTSIQKRKVKSPRKFSLFIKRISAENINEQEPSQVRRKIEKVLSFKSKTVAVPKQQRIQTQIAPWQFDGENVD